MLARHGGFWVGAALLLFGAACAPLPSPAPPAAPLAPVEATLMQALRARTERFSAYRAQVSAKIEGSRGIYTLRMLVVADLPGKVRIEASNLFGQTLGTFVMNPRGAAFYATDARTLYTARHPEILMERFTGVTLAPDLLASMLAGCVPQEAFSASPSLTPIGSGLTLTSPGAPGLTWEFENPSGALSVVAASGKAGRFEARFEPPVPVSPEALPQSLSVFAPAWRIRARVIELQPGRGTATGLFDPPIIPGASHEDLDGGGAGGA